VGRAGRARARHRGKGRPPRRPARHLLLRADQQRRQETHLLELKAIRDWFIPRAKQYPLKTTKTRTGAALYTTVGAIVPVREVHEANPTAVQVFTVPRSTS
jgi:hypothetical protein